MSRCGQGTSPVLLHQSAQRAHSAEAQQPTERRQNGVYIYLDGAMNPATSTTGVLCLRALETGLSIAGVFVGSAMAVLTSPHTAGCQEMD